MVAQTGSPIDDPSIAARFGGLDRQVERILREIGDIPKIPPPASGAVETAIVEATSVPWPAGSNTMSWWEVTYSAPTLARDGGPVSWLTIDGPDIKVAAEGYYSATLAVDFMWPSLAGAPDDSVQVYLGHLSVQTVAPVVKLTPGGEYGFATIITNGVEWMAPTDRWRLDMLGFVGAPSSTPSNAFALWSITRYGA